MAAEKRAFERGAAAVGDRRFVLPNFLFGLPTFMRSHSNFGRVFGPLRRLSSPADIERFASPRLIGAQSAGGGARKNALCGGAKDLRPSALAAFESQISVAFADDRRWSVRRAARKSYKERSTRRSERARARAGVSIGAAHFWSTVLQT